MTEGAAKIKVEIKKVKVKKEGYAITKQGAVRDPTLREQLYLEERFEEGKRKNWE